jgi:hypothetical protein
VFRSTVGKVMWVGRAAVFLLALTVILLHLLGLASRAFGTNGDNLILGRATNTATNLRAVVSNVAKYAKAVLLVQSTGESPALDLRVGEPGSSPADKTVAPMKVNSQVEVTNLNAAFLEGNHASHIAAAYKRTVVVSPVSTDTENGTALLDALSGITDAAATKPYRSIRILGTSRAPPDFLGQCRVCALLWKRWSFTRLRGRKRPFAALVERIMDDPRRREEP